MLILSPWMRIVIFPFWCVSLRGIPLSEVANQSSWLRLLRLRWNLEEGLDIDDSDLLLTPAIRPTNNTHIVPEITTTQTLFSSQNNQVDNCVLKPIRIIPGPAGIVQTAKLHKLVDTRECGEESVMSTQEYIRKVIEDVSEDDNFTRAPWLSAIDYVNVDGGIMRHGIPIRIIPGPAGIVQTTKLCKLVDTQEGGEEFVISTEEYIRKVIEDVGEDDNFTRAPWLSVINYVNVDGGIVTGCFKDVKKFLKNGKLEQIVAVIKSCTPNALGDLTVTLKDLSGTISDTIHYKVLTEERFAKAFTIESALILHNVSVFSPKQSNHHYLNITKKNMLKVFHKDGGSA
ncbi:hypothetical protein Tco_0746003 [Tanacetum coccineum]